jgi:Peptidase A4 family
MRYSLSAQLTRRGCLVATETRSFEPAPAGFDPVHANDSELERHGYPPRPDARRGDLHRRWATIISRARFVPPKFEPLPGPPVSELPPSGGSSLRYSPNWSGLMVWAPDRNSHPVSFVSAIWVVPDVVTPKDASFGVCSIWVGIDGWEDADNTGLVQMGTTCSSDGQTYAWWQWLSRDPSTKTGKRIGGVHVSRGDVVACTVSSPDLGSANFYITNVTTGAGTSFSNPQPSGTQLVGATGEWILESPLDTSGSIVALAPYASAYIDGCWGGYRGGEAFDLGASTAEPIERVDTHNLVDSVPTVVTDTLLRLDFQDTSSSPYGGV